MARPRVYLRDPEGSRQMLRPACRRCTARRGIAEPVACYLPPHLTVCRRHRLWIGPSARTCAGQLDVSHLPEVLRAQRCHATLSHHLDYWHVNTAISDATRTIHQALRNGDWASRRTTPATTARHVRVRHRLAAHGEMGSHLLADQRPHLQMASPLRLEPGQQPAVGSDPVAQDRFLGIRSR